MLAGSMVLSGGGLAWGGGIYKWVDKDGVTHFGEKPPAPGVGEQIKVNSAAPSSGASEAIQKLEDVRTKRLQDVQDKAAAKAATAESDAADKARAEAIKKNCESYRANLKVLNEHGRIKETGTDGQVKMLSDEEKQKRMQDAEKYLSENCKG